MNKPVYILCQLFYPELISSGQTVTELAERLAQSGLPITVFCSQPTINSSEKVSSNMMYKTINIRRLWSTQFSKLHFLGKLLNHLTFGLSCFIKLLCLPKHSKILVFTNPPFLPYLLGILYRFKSFNYIVTVFDLYPETLLAAGMIKKDASISTYLSRLNIHTYKHASHVIAIGKCMKKILDSKMSSINKKATYIPIWADTSLIQNSQTKQNFRKDWGLGHTFIVGYAGNMATFHPIETIMESAKKLNNVSPISFLFVGEGAKKAWAINYAGQHQLTNCYFKPYVCREDLPSLLETFDCGLTGLNAENTGFSVPSKTIGLLSAGIPTIACCSPKSEIADIITSYECGVVCDPNNSNDLAKTLSTIHKKPGILKRYKKNALLAVQKKYNIDKSAAKYLRLFHEKNES
ncbi:glycosyltransferase family 4 protein [bacterium]|nr:glycosyltransferase family 4 protein [bacterium]